MTFRTRPLTGSVAQSAGALTRTWLLSRSTAEAAHIHPRQINPGRAAANGLVETDGNGMLEILPAFRVPAVAPRSLAEDIAEIQIAGPAEVESLKSEPPTGLRSAAFEDSFSIETVQVVKLTLQRITEDVVCLRNPLETIFRMAIARIYVRVKAPGKLPEGPLDVIDGSLPVHFKNDVEIVIVGHGPTSRPVSS